MALKKNSISFKQSINVVTAAFLVGIVIAIGQLYFEFKETRESFNSTIRQVINIAKQTAAQAAYSFDEDSAQQVVAGLFEYPPIYAVKISENFGSVIAYKTRPPMYGELNFLAELLMGDDAPIEIQLLHDNSQVVGKMTVLFSSYHVSKLWYDRSIRTLLSTVIQSVILAIILLVLFNSSITQPLLFIVESLSKINIEKPSDIRLPMPEKHKDDELGLLVTSTNQLLAAIKNDADKLTLLAENTRVINTHLEKEVTERRLAELALREAHATLESRVAERTEALTKEIHVRQQIEIDLNNSKIAAEKANNAKSTFIANMSHEIRTPLNAILGFSQILARNKQLPEDVISTLHTIEKSGSHLLELINDVLDLSKIEAGAISIQQNDFDLNELLFGVSEIFSLRCKQLPINWRLDNRLNQGEAVSGDQRKIRQILINLIGNAIKFTEVGEVSLTITEKISKDNQHNYTFSIQDSGPGISKEDQLIVFNAFSQSSAGKDKGGTGLGLSICTRFLKLMESELFLESQIGEGCRFYFSLNLPPAKAQISSREPRSSQNVRVQCNGEVKALVVDDVAENRILLSFLLEELNVSVMEAENGAVALDQIKDNHFDIVFMDIRMPVMDGYQAVDQIHLLYAEQRPKCVAVSASVINITEENFSEKGFDDFILKPFRIERLYKCLQTLLPEKFVEQNAPISTSDKESGIIPVDIQVNLPGALKLKILDAAKLYQISLLNNLLNEMMLLGEQPTQLANQLRILVNDYQMELLAEKINLLPGD